MIDGGLVFFDWNTDAFLRELIDELDQESAFGKYATLMKRRVSRAKGVPSHWVSHTQGAIETRVALGGIGITVKIGIVNQLPFYRMMQAFVLNKGSGQYGENGIIHGVEGGYLNINTGAYEQGSGNVDRVYPQFGKVGTRWFDDVKSRALSQAQRELNEACRRVLAHRKPKIKGKTATISFKL